MAQAKIIKISQPLIRSYIYIYVFFLWAGFSFKVIFNNNYDVFRKQLTENWMLQTSTVEWMMPCWRAHLQVLVVISC